MSSPRHAVIGGCSCSKEPARSAWPLSVFLANAVFSLAFRRTWGLSILLAIGTTANFVLASTFATSGNSAQGVLGFVVTAMYLGTASSGYVYPFASRADYAHYTAM